MFKKIVIIGLGLIGASIAEATRHAWPDTYLIGVDSDAHTCEKALEKSLVNEVLVSNDPHLSHIFLQDVNLVIIATPVEAAADYFKLIAESGYNGIITDTASTKDRIVSMANEALPEPWHFLPGHPMAGSEVNGIEGARDDLFQGNYWILCPDEQTPIDYLPALHEYITGLGARVIVLPREQHDHAVAVVSHVPHFIAASLVMLAAQAADDQQSIMRLAAGGFKDTTRIAAGSPQLWSGIAFDNLEQVKSGLCDMKSIINQFIDVLEESDQDALCELLSGAADIRRSLPASWVPSLENLIEVRMPISNHPGAVAQATALASEVGCNIQSIEIDHVTEDRAYLSLVITEKGLLVRF